ncbi:MAG: glycosyltransferase family 4 protein [Euryarchaeota archaeon]|nr:glycosyltransferase family 4 protein [Euryarchaeota archaeon]
MRVTLVSPFDPHGAPEGAHVGGVERVYAELSHRLSARGHEVTLVSTTDGSQPDPRPGVRVVQDRRRLTVLRTPVARLARHVTGDADIVQVPATYPFTTPPVLRRARRLGVPSVLDFHFEPVPGSAFGRVAADWYQRFGPRSYALADAVLVRSLAYARSAASLAHVPDSRWRVVPNGVDHLRFRPDGPRRPGDYLLFVGRLVPYKGLEVLLEALRLLVAPPRLVVAGDGPERQRWQRLAQALRVDVEWLGRVPEEDLAPLYRGARAAVLPSVSRQEAFGITLLESMACGTPVVASDLPGVAEIARLGGVTAPPGDAMALARTLRRLLHGSPERGPALATRIHGTFSWDAVVDRVLAVYKEVVGGPAFDSPEEVRAVAYPGHHALL